MTTTRPTNADGKPGARTNPGSAKRSTAKKRTARRATLPATADVAKRAAAAVATGRISFVGAGAGDPGLLTARAATVLRGADLVVADTDAPEAVAAEAGDAERAQAVGTAKQIAKSLVGAAKSGKRVVRLVLGDALVADAVIAEVRAVAAAAVPFEVVPGMPSATTAAAYAGIPTGSCHTIADVRAVKDWEALVAAPGTVMLNAAAEHLGDAATGLIDAGLDPSTPAAITAGATLATQRTVDATIENLETAGGALAGPLVVTIGPGLADRPAISWWESRSLYSWQVLVPQTRERYDGMLDRIASHGGIPTTVPTMSVEPPRSPAQMERSVKGLVDGRYQWLVFTSVNSVRAIREKFSEFGLDSRAYSGVRIACVDDVTAEAVAEIGLTPDLVSGDQQLSAGLLDTFPEFDDILDPVDRVLVPRADIATETLAAGLRDRGWEVDDVTAYRTVRASPPAAEIREAIKTGGFDAVCFTSVSTVRNLVGIAGKPHARTIVACLGPKTAEAAREFGLQVDVLAERPEVDLLVESLAAHADYLRAQDALPPPRRASRRK